MLSANPSVNPNGGRYGLIDVTLRDAHQCLWSTRMTTAMMAPILSTIDCVGYDFVNILGWYDNEWGFSNRMVDVTKAFAATL